MNYEQVKKAWRNRGEILQGVVNSVFIKDEIEKIAFERNEICKSCESYDLTGDGCDVLGTQPCCSNLNGGCGCVLHLKQRSLSSECPKGFWGQVLTQEEEDSLIK